MFFIIQAPTTQAFTTPGELLPNLSLDFSFKINFSLFLFGLAMRNLAVTNTQSTYGFSNFLKIKFYLFYSESCLLLGIMEFRRSELF